MRVVVLVFRSIIRVLSRNWPILLISANTTAFPVLKNKKEDRI